MTFFSADGKVLFNRYCFRISHIFFVFLLAFVFIQANINGRVLAQCNIDELKKEMNMNFGDWHLFRSTVRYLIFMELLTIVYKASADQHWPKLLFFCILVGRISTAVCGNLCLLDISLGNLGKRQPANSPRFH